MGVYARILRIPGVATIVLATAVGRLPIGISGLAILLYVQEVSGSFAAADSVGQRFERIERQIAELRTELQALREQRSG